MTVDDDYEEPLLTVVEVGCGCSTHLSPVLSWQGTAYMLASTFVACAVSISAACVHILCIKASLHITMYCA